MECSVTSGLMYSSFQGASEWCRSQQPLGTTIAEPARTEVVTSSSLGEPGDVHGPLQNQENLVVVRVALPGRGPSERPKDPDVAGSDPSFPPRRPRTAIYQRGSSRSGRMLLGTPDSGTGSRWD
jgi:hypothetical protein